MDLTKEHFELVAKAFFIALPQVNAITISNLFFGKRNGHFFTLWKDDNFERNVDPEKVDRWQYISTIKENNMIGHIRFSNFDFYLRTKGTYVFRRKEFGIPNQPYKILNQSVFFFKFGAFFGVFPNLQEVHYKTGNKMVLKGNEFLSELEFDNGYIVRSGNQNFQLVKNEWHIIGSLIIAYKNHINKEKEIIQPYLFDRDTLTIF